ncbi:hypothetical protein BH11VER1_BH11VER1_27100 [soil metagenome]
MLYPVLAGLFCIPPSWLLIRAIERCAVSLWGGPLSLWRRILIPLPIICFLAANLDGVLSLLSYLSSHPEVTSVARYEGNQAWDTDRFFNAGLFSVGLLPFVIAPTPLRGFLLLPVVWVGHVLWIMFPFAPLLLATGVPFQQ